MSSVEQIVAGARGTWQLHQHGPGQNYSVPCLASIPRCNPTPHRDAGPTPRRLASNFHLLERRER